MKARHPAKRSSAKPARKLPKSAVQAGEVFAIPVTDVGYCNGVVSRAPNLDTGLMHVYLRLEATEMPLAPQQIGLPHEWASAWIGLTSSKGLQSGRWQRQGQIASFDPEEFPIPPLGATNKAEDEEADSKRTRYWIEVMPDGPSMSPLACIAATKESIAPFPAMEIVVAASKLETSLRRHFREMGFTFWDVPIAARVVRPGDVKKWTQFARPYREHVDPGYLKLKPAGVKTDRGSQPGDWFAFPLPGGGFGAAVLLAKPPRHMRCFSDTVVMSVRRSWDRWPTIEDVLALKAEDGAYIAQTTFIVVRDGRWRCLGRDEQFCQDDWPWPLPWEQLDSGMGLCNVELGFIEKSVRTVRIEEKILKQDPLAGKVMDGMSSPGSIVEGTVDALSCPAGSAIPSELRWQEANFVSPQRIAAWKVINSVLLKAAEKFR